MALQKVLEACRARLTPDALQIVEDPANQNLLVQKQLVSPAVISDLTYEQLTAGGLSMGLAGALKKAFPTAAAAPTTAAASTPEDRGHDVVAAMEALLKYTTEYYRLLKRDNASLTKKRARHSSAMHKHLCWRPGSLPLVLEEP